MRLPAQHTQNQIKHEKGAEDHETDKVHPWKLKAHCVIHLEGPRTPAEEEEEQWEERRRNRVKNTLSRTQQAFNLQMENKSDLPSARIASCCQSEQLRASSHFVNQSRQSDKSCLGGLSKASSACHMNYGGLPDVGRHLN